MFVYCDLDGVLVDLAGRLSEIYGVDLSKAASFNDYFYDHMDTLDDRQKVEFWENLSELPDAMMLWDFIKQYKPSILTACSGSTAACFGKKHWCRDHLGLSSSRVFCVSKSNRKQYYACEGKLLIDDLESNVNEWEAKGGVGILHKNAEDTIIKLKDVLKDY